jgi:hypothetical protein
MFTLVADLRTVGEIEMRKGRPADGLFLLAAVAIGLAAPGSYL